MTTINHKMERVGLGLFLKAGAILIAAAFTIAIAMADSARTVTLLAPLDGATVREIVPVRISPADLPADGYVTVSIDKVFRTAKLIDPGSSLIYTWDSQAAFQDPNNPGVDKFTDDGSHEIEVSVYDHQGNLLAAGTSTVTLANKVTNLPDGIELAYNWSEDETLRYKRHSEINVLSNGNESPAQNAQSANFQFDRSVEDSTGGNYLVRDLVLEGGSLTANGTSTPVESLYLLKSRYRTVNRYGDTLVEETPFSTGDHFGFPIAQIPARRITVGDSWSAKIETEVTWASTKPTVLNGTARLDSFEWQDGYPTAKVIESYDGPARFYADPIGTVRFQADNVHLVRTYWFAYNSKRLVRIKTDMTIDANVTSDVVTLLGATAAIAQGQNGAPGSNPNGSPGSNPSMPGGYPYGPPGGNPSTPGGYPYGPPGQAPNSQSLLTSGLDGLLNYDQQIQSPFGGAGGFGQQGQPGGGQFGANGQATATTPIKLEILDDTNLLVGE